MPLVLQQELYMHSKKRTYKGLSKREEERRETQKKEEEKSMTDREKKIFEFRFSDRKVYIYAKNSHSAIKKFNKKFPNTEIRAFQTLYGEVLRDE